MASSRKSGNGGLILIILYMFLEYVRPQSFITGLAVLRIPMLVQIAIIFSLLNMNLDRLKSKESITFLLLLCVMALHIPFATNNYWAYYITRIMALQFVVFLGIVGFLDTYEKLNRVVGLWIFVAILCAVRGYLEGGHIPDSGILGDENDFSLFLNMMIPIAFFAAQSADSKRAKAFFYSGVVVLILGTVSSMSRGGFLGMVPPLLYCWLRTPGKIKTGAAAAVVGLFLVVAVIPKEYWAEMRTIREEGTSTGTGSQRMYLWRHGTMMFLEHPLFGVGPGNFNWNIATYEPPEGFNGRSQGGRPAHSIYFTMLPELGLAGTFLFFRLIWVNQNESRKLRRESKKVRNRNSNKDRLKTIDRLSAFSYGLTGAIIAYLVSGAFLSVLYYGHFWLIVALAVTNNHLLKAQLQQLNESVAIPEGLTDENSSDRWQYSGGLGDYPFTR